MATHSVFLPGNPHGQGSLVGYSSWDCKVGHDLVIKSPPLPRLRVWANLGYVHACKEYMCVMCLCTCRVSMCVCVCTCTYIHAHTLTAKLFTLLTQESDKGQRGARSICRGLYRNQFSSVTQLWLFATPWTAARQPSPTPRACSNSCPSSQWCHPTILSSVIPFSSCLQSFPTSGSFPMSQFFALGGQSIGVSASASVLPMNIQDWFPLGWTGWISLQSKGLSRVFSNITVQKHQIEDEKLRWSGVSLEPCSFLGVGIFVCCL